MFVQIYLLLCYPSFFLIITVRNEVAKVMFLHLSVILFTGGGTWAGTPPGQVHPRADTPPRPGAPLLGRYTPQTGTPPRQVHPRQVHPQARYTPRAGTPPGPGTPPGSRYGYCCGMHSCLSVCPCVWLPLIPGSIPRLAWCMLVPSRHARLPTRSPPSLHAVTPHSL